MKIYRYFLLTSNLYLAKISFAHTAITDRSHDKCDF